jgi:hypothetical protein
MRLQQAVFPFAAFACDDDADDDLRQGARGIPTLPLPAF